MQLDQVNTLGFEPNFDKFLSGKPPKLHGDRFIRVHISRNTLLAIAFSLLLHAIVFFFAPKINFDVPPELPATTMEVSLAAPEPVKTPEPAVAESTPVAVEAKPETVYVKPKVIAQKLNNPIKPSTTMPEVVKAPEPVPEKFPQKEPVEKTQPVEEKFTDMASYVKAMQARRQGGEYEAARQNAEAAARERGPSEEQLRDERIKRNFQNGTNGIFEITSLGSRNATFAFRGWTNDFSSSKRQFFEVEAQSGQDVRLVMIKRMIALIREHYQGDFIWQSHRLGGSVTQSARLEDNAGLEDFLMMEFFGTNYKNSS